MDSLDFRGASVFDADRTKVLMKDSFRGADLAQWSERKNLVSRYFSECVFDGLEPVHTEESVWMTMNLLFLESEGMRRRGLEPTPQAIPLPVLYHASKRRLDSPTEWVSVMHTIKSECARVPGLMQAIAAVPALLCCRRAGEIPTRALREQMKSAEGLFENKDRPSVERISMALAQMVRAIERAEGVVRNPCTEGWWTYYLIVNRICVFVLWMNSFDPLPPEEDPCLGVLTSALRVICDQSERCFPELRVKMKAMLDEVPALVRFFVA
ncbi:MAG: hypothetical protein ACYCPS_06210 [Candidatus Saccharimonadales bacterium]